MAASGIPHAQLSTVSRNSSTAAAIAAPEPDASGNAGITEKGLSVSEVWRTMRIVVEFLRGPAKAVQDFVLTDREPEAILRVAWLYEGYCEGRTEAMDFITKYKPVNRERLIACMDTALLHGTCSQVRGAIASCSESILNDLAASQLLGFKASERWRNDEHLLMSVGRRLTRRGKRATKRGLFLAHHARGRECLILSDADGDTFQNVVLPFVRNSCDEFAQVHLNTQHLLEAVSQLEADPYVQQVIVRGLSARRRFVNRQGRKYLETVRLSCKRSLAEARGEIEREDASLRSARVEYRLDKQYEARGDVRMRRVNALCRLTYESEFIVNRDFHTFMGSVGLLVFEEMRKHLAAYAGRSREVTPENRARPFALQCAEPMFGDSEKMSALSTALDKLPQAVVTVLHGNPYFHANILDLIDGSTYDVGVYSADRVIITPQRYASVAALERVCHHITDTMAKSNFELQSEI